MKWKDGPPLKHGWYWWEDDDGSCIIQVSNFKDHPNMAFFVTGRRELISNMKGRHAGPIKFPKGNT
jgi:hypothetical protein